jgi:hypothetical protein
MAFEMGFGAADQGVAFVPREACGKELHNPWIRIEPVKRFPVGRLPAAQDQASRLEAEHLFILSGVRLPGYAAVE